MQVIIELTDEQWKCVQDGTWCGTKEILSGIPLPKGHGELVDMSEVIVKLMQYFGGNKTIGQCLDEVHTVIEADGGAE